MVDDLVAIRRELGERYAWDINNEYYHTRDLLF